MPVLRPARRALLGVALAAALAVGASGCSAASADTDGTLSVVASTNVYGGLAAGIGGPYVTVTSFVAGGGQDPHSYEASAHDELALAKADVVVENGGGYDDFVDDLLAAAGGSATVLNAVELSGRAASADGPLNEHVWYDLAAVRRVVAALVAALSAADPSHAAVFATNAEKLSAGLDGLQRTEARLRSEHRGEGVAITEPVPLYLLRACGLVDRTPAAFSVAIEDGTGVPASVLAATLHLFSDHAVRALVYNAQTSGPETDQIVSAAENAGVPTVPVTETMPAGQSYVSWMRATLTALARALR
jgi:zinc/manganese transport system substrate-binding protein